MLKFIKRFKEWLTVKSRLDHRYHEPPMFNEREIWWCSIGENIGVEISGKGDLFFRPILIVKKLDRFSYLGVPLTTTKREGDRYHSFFLEDVPNTIIISQIRHMDYRRMYSLISTLPTNDFVQVQMKIIALFS